jgi:hypothetical protein
MTGRTLCWFSDGIASAIATKFWLKDHPDALVVRCETGSEDEDNERFRNECAAWFGKEITTLSNPNFTDTYSVWAKRRYISGIAGAPCTMELKVSPRLAFQLPDDTHVFGYTFDGNDRKRFAAMQANYPEMLMSAPLIEREITKSNCLAIMQDTGIKEPRSYAMGFPNANCLQSGCAKATSPRYWSLYRQTFPDRFAKTAAVSRDIGCRMLELNGERKFLDELPEGYPTLNPIAPTCDFLCHINGKDLAL